MFNFICLIKLEAHSLSYGDLYPPFPRAECYTYMANSKWYFNEDFCHNSFSF